jgi:hypothetical protein
MAEVAGCVQGHKAFIFDRGGTRRAGGEVIDLSKVQWERARDAVSTAMIRLEGDACRGQSSLIDGIRSHRHELVIFRGRDRVWEGPIQRVASHENFAEIHAKDVLTYLGAQPLTRVWDNTSNGDGVTEMTTRFRDIIEFELANGRIMQDPLGNDVAIPAWEALDPPVNLLPYLDVRNFPNEARTAAKTLAYQMSVLTHLQSAARTSGIDFTAFGRKILIWDVSRNLGVLPTMTSANFFNKVIVTEYGADHTQAAYVIGQEGVFGSALNLDNLDYYGPWTTMFTAYNEEGTNAPGVGELNSQAQRNLTGRSPAPIEVRIPDNSGIILSDTLSIQQLIPGVQIPLRATLNSRKLAQVQKIDHVKVIEDASKETIQITLTPATKPDVEEEP